jgi:uncharacterized protein HemX
MASNIALPAPETPPSSHAKGRYASVLAMLALIIACYSLWRLDTTLERLDRVGELTSRISASQEALRAELTATTASEARARNELDQRLAQLDSLPSQIQQLEATVQELRNRTSGSQRAYVKSEVSYLLDAAQRSVAFDGDVRSAIVALESADTLLATLLDPALLPVRQQMARELNSLRSVARPDLATIQLRLTSAEEQAATIPIKGRVVLERPRLNATELPQVGWWARGWAVGRQAIATLITVRKVEDAASRVVQPEEQLLRRQHLQLLLFSARQAVVRRDGSSYRSSLGSARQWLGQFFDLQQPAGEALLNEVTLLEPLNIAPIIPEITASARMLRELEPQLP